MASSDAQLYPVFLRLAERDVLLVGGGTVAKGKLKALLAAGARITVVAPDIQPEIEAAPVTILRRAFQPSDLDGKWFVVSAASGQVNREVADAASARHIFVNAVDDVDAASAYLGGVVHKSGVTLAISTQGSAPALAGLLREALEAVLPPDLSRWQDVAQQLRAKWRAEGTPMEQRRPLLLQALNALYAHREHP